MSREAAKFGNCMDRKFYDDLKKKFPSLPEFDQLNEEFEISLIEKTDFLLRQIRRRIKERIEELVNFLENIIQPSAETFVSFYECSCFNDDEKKHILKSFKKLMVLHRSLVYADILQDNEKDVEAIKLASNDFPSLRHESSQWMEKLKIHWHELKEAKEILEYLG